MTGFRRIDIRGVRVIPMAAPSHPLAEPSEAAPPQARDFIQLVLSEQPAGAGRRCQSQQVAHQRSSNKAQGTSFCSPDSDGAECRNRSFARISKPEGSCN
jgi:hypothetical protein